MPKVPGSPNARPSVTPGNLGYLCPQLESRASVALVLSVQECLLAWPKFMPTLQDPAQAWLSPDFALPSIRHGCPPPQALPGSPPHLPCSPLSPFAVFL